MADFLMLYDERRRTHFTTAAEFKTQNAWYICICGKRLIVYLTPEGRGLYLINRVKYNNGHDVRTPQLVDKHCLLYNVPDDLIFKVTHVVVAMESPSGAYNFSVMKQGPALLLPEVSGKTPGLTLWACLPDNKLLIPAGSLYKDATLLQL